MKKLFIVFMCMVIPVMSFAGDFNNSIRTFVGGNDYSIIDKSGEPDYSWFSISYNPTTIVNDYFSYSNSLGLGVIDANDESTLFVEYRLLGRIKLYKGLYMQGGGGLSHGFSPNNIPHLANSPLYGILSGEIGYEFSDRYSLGYTLEHLSSPFHDDSGLNVGALLFTVKF